MPNDLKKAFNFHMCSFIKSTSPRVIFKMILGVPKLLQKTPNKLNILLGSPSPSGTLCPDNRLDPLQLQIVLELVDEVIGL